MDFREKAALILLGVIIYETACSKCMPQSLRDSPFERYLNKQRSSSNIPTTHGDGRKTHRFQDDLIKKNKLYSKISPIDVSDSFINNLKREKRMKRKLQRAQKIYTRDNDETLTIPAFFHNQGPPFYLSEVGLFPEVQYPLTASDTWTPNYWNSLHSNNHDKFFKKDAYFTGRTEPNTDFNVIKKPLTAKNNKSSATVKKSEETLKRKNIKMSTGAKSNKIVRQTTASQGQKKNAENFVHKDENDIEKYIMETSKLTQNKKVSTESNEKIRKSKKKQVNETKKEFNQNISNDRSNETQTKKNNRHTKKQNIITKDKINASLEKINTAVPLEKMSKVTKQKNTSIDNDPENLSNIENTPKAKERTCIKNVSKKSKSSIKEITSHFSKLITKLEKLSNKNSVTPTTSNNQLISFSPTNGTSNSVKQEHEQKTKGPAQNNLSNILQVETKVSKENTEAPGSEILNLVQTVSDKIITSDEVAQTSFKTNEEESDFPFSFTDYVVRNQLLDVLSDPKLSISSLRNGIFKILEEIDSKSVEESDEASITEINESTHMLPLLDKYLEDANFKSELPDHGISCLDKQNLSSENFNEANLPCTNASDSFTKIIFKNNIFDDKSNDTQHSDNVCEDDKQIPDHFVTGSLAENLRNVISEPSSSKTLIEDLSEIIRLLTVWNSHTDDSCENIYHTTEIDTIDGYVPIMTELSSKRGPKTAASDHSYEIVFDSDVIDHSTKDGTQYSCDIHKSNVMGHLRKDVSDCSTADSFEPYETNQSKYEDATNNSCENNALEYSSDNSAYYSCKNYNETEYSNENMADPTYNDIYNPNATEYLNKKQHNQTESSYENVAGIRKNIHKHNVSEDLIDDIRSFNLTDHSSEDQTENICEDVHKPNVNLCEEVINDSCKDGPELNVMYDSNEDESDYSKEDINKPNTTKHSCEDTANFLYEDKSKSIVTNYSGERIRELYATCYSIEFNYSGEDTNKSSDENVAYACYDIYNPKVSVYSNEDNNSLKATVISGEYVNDNSYKEICKLNVSNQLNKDNNEYSCENIQKHNATVYSSEAANDASCEHFYNFNETRYLNENKTGTRGDTKPNINNYSNESVVDNSYEYISTPNVTDYYSNEDNAKNSWEGIHRPNSTVCSCEDMSDCLNLGITSNVTYFSNEEEINFSREQIHNSNVTDYCNVDETEYSSEDTYKPKLKVNLNKSVIDYSNEVIDEQYMTDHSNQALVDYSCEDVGSFATENSSDVIKIPYSDNFKLKSNVTDHSNETLNNFSSEDIALSNVIKRKVKNMAKLTRFEHAETEKHNMTKNFSETITDYAYNDLFKPNTTNYLSEVLPNAFENIPKANVDYSKERIPESSGANYLNEDVEIVSDSPTIYHIPFEKLTYASNDKLSYIDIDGYTVSDKVTEDSLGSSHRDLSETPPLSVSPSFTYEVNEEIPDTKFVTFEKIDNITSAETTDKESICNDNFTADFLSVFTIDDVFESISDDSETPRAFVSTYLSSFDENILKLHNETETEMCENDLPTIPNRDTKTYDEICPITGNESSENVRFLVDELAYLKNSRCFTNDKEDLPQLNPFTNNNTALFGDEDNPDFYDFILYPEECEYTEVSKSNDTRELNSDTTLDFTDYTMIPEDTTFTENSGENFIETLATTVYPFDQYDDIPEQNAESNVSEDSSKSHQILHNLGNTYVTQGTPFESNREVTSSTDYTSLLEDPKLTKYFDDFYEEEHEFRPLYERNVKPLLHRDVTASSVK